MEMIPLSLLLTSVFAIGGILISNSYHQADAIKEVKTDYDTRYLEIKKEVADNLKIVKDLADENRQDIKEIKNMLIAQNNK